MKKHNGFRKRQQEAGGGRLAFPIAAAAGAAAGLAAAAGMMALSALAAVWGWLGESALRFAVPAIQAASLWIAMTAAVSFSREKPALAAPVSGLIVWSASYALGMCMKGQGIAPEGLIFLGMIAITAAIKALRFREIAKAS